MSPSTESDQRDSTSIMSLTGFPWFLIVYWIACSWSSWMWIRAHSLPSRFWTFSASTDHQVNLPWERGPSSYRSPRTHFCQQTWNLSPRTTDRPPFCCYLAVWPSHSAGMSAFSAGSGNWRSSSPSCIHLYRWWGSCPPHQRGWVASRSCQAAGYRNTLNHYVQSFYSKFS